MILPINKMSAALVLLRVRPGKVGAIGLKAKWWYYAGRDTGLAFFIQERHRPRSHIIVAQGIGMDHQRQLVHNGLQRRWAER